MAGAKRDPRYRMVRSVSGISGTSSDGQRLRQMADVSDRGSVYSDAPAPESRPDFPGATSLLGPQATPVAPGLESMLDQSPRSFASGDFNLNMGSLAAETGGAQSQRSAPSEASPSRLDDDAKSQTSATPRKKPPVKLRLTAEALGKLGVAGPGHERKGVLRRTTLTGSVKVGDNKQSLAGRKRISLSSPISRQDSTVSGMYNVIKKLRDEREKAKFQEQKKRRQYTVLSKSRDTIAHLECALRSQSLNPDAKWRKWWDLLTLFFIAYYWFAVPLQYVFDREGFGWDVIEVVASLCFGIDVFLRFRTSFIEPASGLVVDTPQKIQDNYLYGDFVWDFLAAVPADLLSLWFLKGTGWGQKLDGRAYLFFSHFRMFKIMRVPSLFQIVTIMKLDKRVVNFQFVVVPNVKMVFYAILTLHLVTVLFMLINSDDPEYTYTTCLYWTLYTVTTVGYGDISVDSPMKKRFACVLFIVGVLLHGVCISEITLRMQKANVETERRDKMTETLSIMEMFNIPEELQKEVLAFQYHQLHSCVSGAFVQVLETLPVTMRNRVGLYVRVKFICQVPMFAEQPIDCLVDLANGLKNIVLEPESEVIRAGENGAEMFFVGHGYCDVLSPTGDHWGVIKPGGFFGEIALLTECKRTATIKSLTYCDLFRLPKGKFLEIHGKHQELRDAVRQEMMRRQIALPDKEKEEEEEGTAEDAGSLKGSVGWLRDTGEDPAPSENQGSPEKRQSVSQLLMMVSEGTQIISTTAEQDPFAAFGLEAGARGFTDSHSSAVPPEPAAVEVPPPPPSPAQPLSSPASVEKERPASPASPMSPSGRRGTCPPVLSAARSPRPSQHLAAQAPVIAMTPPQEDRKGKGQIATQLETRMRRLEDRLDEITTAARRVEDLVGELLKPPPSLSDASGTFRMRSATAVAAAPFSEDSRDDSSAPQSAQPLSLDRARRLLGSSGSLTELRAAGVVYELKGDTDAESASPALSAAGTPGGVELADGGSGRLSPRMQRSIGSPPHPSVVRPAGLTSPASARPILRRSPSQASVESLANGATTLVGIDEPMAGERTSPRRASLIVPKSGSGRIVRTRSQSQVLAAQPQYVSLAVASHVSDDGSV
eukprot:TRINITY_DN8281_c0_g1_i1.p1 TRINITY_DN8281_c0_g1~~TRINITY_DN8281_c0_g1_i1.p1  ORF type:complete len:1107 (+),score=294.30 TRINITY_DN8281_c0_g1_i1:56-3376(+)